MSASVRACPACDSTASRRAGTANGFSLLRCARCATLFTATLPETAEANDYDAYYSAANLDAPAVIRRSLDRIVAGFEPFRTSGRLLDVGFGAALVLQAAKRAGWDAWGVEVSKPAIDHAISLGLQVVHGTLAEAPFPAAHFDVIVAAEVLEHVPDARGLVRDIARLLRPGGLFWLTTPNARGLSARLLGSRWSVVSPPEHLQLLSPAGLRSVLGSAGLHPERVRTTGVNPYELIAAARRRGDAPRPAFDRVGSGYELLIAADRRRSLGVAKAAVNGVLGVLGIGDSMRVWAVSS